MTPAVTSAVTRPGALFPAVTGVVASGDLATHPLGGVSCCGSHNNILRRHNAENDSKEQGRAPAQDHRKEGGAVRWPSDESAALGRVRKLALGLQRSLTILALITGTLTGVLLASSGLPVRGLIPVTGNLSPFWPRTLFGPVLNHPNSSSPCSDARSSSDDVTTDDLVLQEQQQLDNHAADVRNRQQQDEEQQHRQHEEEDLEPVAREILRVSDEAVSSERRRGSDEGEGSDDEEGSGETLDKSADDVAIARRAAEVYESWTRLYFPELVRKLKRTRRKGRRLREDGSIRDDGGSVARVADSHRGARGGIPENERGGSVDSSGAEAVLEGESLWDVATEAGDHGLGGIRAEKASHEVAQEPGKKVLGFAKAEVMGEEKGGMRGGEEGKLRGESRGEQGGEGKGEGGKEKRRGRQSDAQGKEGRAESRVGVPRPFHLQNCTLLQTVYREDGWIEGPPLGELPAWAQIRDPRGGASQDAQDYILPPANRQKMQRHWASHTVNKSVTDAFWWPAQKAEKRLVPRETGSNSLQQQQQYSRVLSQADRGGGLRDPLSEGPFPPWVEGGDEDNYPLTRRVQRDIWVHQHPPNCSDPSVKFWFSGVGPREKHGFGAQMNMAAGALALALAEGRVLVLRRFNRAAHKGCTGADYNRLSCYFAPETSQACRRRVDELMRDPRSTRGRDPPLKLWAAAHPLDYFFPPVPPLWGQPWLRIPPVVEANGRLIRTNRMGNKYRWWRAQAFKYLLRAPTLHTCHVVNRERHLAFGQLAALEVARGESALRDLGHYMRAGADMRPGPTERELWALKPPWAPRPLVAMHVRMGDKAREMAIAGVEDYLELLGRVRRFDPLASHVWLSTEMQLVVDAALEQKGWHWHYTKVRRIRGNGNRMKMPLYEESLGVKESMENSLANLFISLQADYFIGALGSAWSYLIDGLRCTSGKMRNGFLSTNLSPRW